MAGEYWPPGGSHDLCPLQMTALWRAWRVVRKPRLPGCFSMKLTSHLPDDRRAHVEGRLRANLMAWADDRAPRWAA